MEIKVSITGLDKLIRNFSGAPQILGKEVNKAFDESLKVIEREVKLRTPVDTGILRASIGKESAQGWRWVKGIIASIGTRVKYAFWVEVRPARHKVGMVGYFSKGIQASIDGIHKVFVKAMERLAKQITK